MGVLQAGEAIKLVAGGGLDPLYGVKSHNDQAKLRPSMLLYSAGNASVPFRNVTLRGRRPDCFACSAQAGLTLESLTSGSLDYVAFCGRSAPINILRPEERIEARNYAEMRLKDGTHHLLVDVREEVEFDICSINGSINVPFSQFHASKISSERLLEKPFWASESLSDDAPIYVICRLGNDSQVVARQLKEMRLDENRTRHIYDIKGGFRAWKEQVDSSWPEY